MPSKYTSGGLPVISEKLVKTMYEQFAGKKIDNETTAYGQWLNQARDRMIKENPELVDFIEKQVGGYPRQFHDPMFQVLAAMYGILEAQNQENRLGNNEPKVKK